MPIRHISALADALSRVQITPETFAYNAKVDVNPLPVLPVKTRGNRFKLVPAVTSVPPEEWSPEYADGRFNFACGKRGTVVRDAIRVSKFRQGFDVQSKNFEKHVCLTKPVKHRYPPAIPAHDRAEDWTREGSCKVDVNLQQKIKADTQLRAKLQALANEGAFDDED